MIKKSYECYPPHILMISLKQKKTNYQTDERKRKPKCVADYNVFRQRYIAHGVLPRKKWAVGQRSAQRVEFLLKTSLGVTFQCLRCLRSLRNARSILGRSSTVQILIAQIHRPLLCVLLFREFNAIDKRRFSILEFASVWRLQVSVGQTSWNINARHRRWPALRLSSSIRL